MFRSWVKKLESLLRCVVSHRGCSGGNPDTWSCKEIIKWGPKAASAGIFLAQEREFVWNLAPLSCQRQIHAGFLCSSRKLGFQVVLWVWFVVFLVRNCVSSKFALSRDWDLNHRMWLRRKKIICYKWWESTKDILLSGLLQCLPFLHLVSLICWSCKLGGVRTLFYFVFAQCPVQFIHSFNSGSVPQHWWQNHTSMGLEGKVKGVP